jgi:fluoride ion exporter CrcB/FEX
MTVACHLSRGRFAAVSRYYFISQFACLSFDPGEKADTAIVNGIGCFGKIAQDFCLVFVGQMKGR